MAVKVKKGNLEIKDKNVVAFYTAEVAKFGNSAKLNCKKEFLGKKAVVIILGDSK